MADAKPQYTDDVPDDVTAHLRKRCLALPDAYEESAWVGTRWCVRKRTFAHVLTVEQDDRAPLVILVFRAAGEDLEMLSHAGHPFFAMGWGRNALGMVIDDDTDWDEVGELVTDSYCVFAPKKLVALVDRPDAEEDTTTLPP